ncbi:unnamed protein product [Hymenolepis diminuta]|uniref:Integrase catalytic domain-containing protein n=1 Tax=Hymenolepis diminuta TaxID=6216 RepID=A0A564YU02_HYMDI|nr:unnamed protein product [Hymenolepis diminuta]
MPETTVLDNGTQFSLAKFHDFCRSHNIIHVYFPLYHSQSNGQAERFESDTSKVMRVLYEVKVDGQSWVRHCNYLRPRYATKWVFWIPSLTFFDLPLLGNHGTPEIQPSSQQNLRFEISRIPSKDSR